MICNKCGQEKDISQFYFMRTKNVYRKECLDCLKLYRLKHSEGKKEREKTNSNLYQKYFLQFNQANNTKEKFVVKKSFYQEKVNEVTLDRIWEDIIEKSIV